MKMRYRKLRIHQLSCKKILISNRDFPTTVASHNYDVDEERINPMSFYEEAPKVLRSVTTELNLETGWRPVDFGGNLPKPNSNPRL